MSIVTIRKFVIKDADGNTLQEHQGVASENQQWIGTELTDGTVVASVEQLPDLIIDDNEPPALTTVEERRQERNRIFATTIDIMNPIWYNSLTAQQQTELATWRTQWLNYPETGIEPTADVSDIFTN